MTSRRYDPADYERIYGSPLRDNQIRLLDVSTSSTSTDDVHGTLKTYELGETDFIAISYVWGDESKLVPICLNGSQFWVTQNADTILKLLSSVSGQSRTAKHHARKLLAKSKMWIDGMFRQSNCRSTQLQREANTELGIFAGSKIWIDAISIDQANSSEKEVQVANMREIYQAASKTLIWLGSPSVEIPRSKPAMIWLKQIVESMPDESFYKGPDNRRHLWDDDAYSSLCHMMEQPWFRRRWVVQEAAVSQSPLLVYGTQVLSLTIFNEASERVGYLYTDRASMPPRPLVKAFDPGFVWAVNRLRNPAVGKLSSLRCVNLLSDFRLTNSSNPLDRIYALLGLCKENERAGNRPDYGISIGDALIRFTVSHIRVNNDLDILCLATKAARMQRQREAYIEGHIRINPPRAEDPEVTFIPDLPTWVPNLTSSGAYWKLGRAVDMAHEDNHASLFDASNGLPAGVHSLDTTRSNETLLVGGIEIDEIEAIELCTPAPEASYDDPHALVFEHIWAFARQHWKPRALYPTPLDLLTAFFRTMSAGGRHSGSRDILTDAYLRHYCLTFLGPGRLGQMLISEYGMEPMPAVDRQYKDPNAEARHNGHRRVSFFELHRHVFASTKSGRFALVPIFTQPGDRIFVLYGCTSPLVLRENAVRPGYYQTNGEAYIDGFMYGEAIQHEMNGLLTGKTIILE